VNDVSPRDFRRHIELSLAAGKRFVPASEIARTGGEPNDLAITFDDGLRSVLTNGVPILKQYNIPWSLYIVTDWCDQLHPWGEGVMLSWREVEAIVVAGGEIGSHSVTHPDFGVLEPNLIEDELGESKRMIEDRLGSAPQTFAIPLGQSKNWTETAARAAATVGYSTIFAQAEETRPPNTVPRTFVTKFDGERVFRALLKGAFDHWEEWV
jgi:peptidoglycan/xylan/chitin deacetylase (PgdA/CDA1 family)